MNQVLENKKYDLEERTAKFGEDVLYFLRTVKPNVVNRRIIEQLVGSSGSVGANYCEAIEGESRKDFAHKIGIAKKEIKETRHWFRLLACAEPEKKDEIKTFLLEANELLLIFARIYISAKSKIEN